MHCGTKPLSSEAAPAHTSGSPGLISWRKCMPTLLRCHDGANGMPRSGGGSGHARAWHSSNTASEAADGAVTTITVLPSASAAAASAAALTLRHALPLCAGDVLSGAIGHSRLRPRTMDSHTIRRNEGAAEALPASPGGVVCGCAVSGSIQISQLLRSQHQRRSGDVARTSLAAAGSNPWLQTCRRRS